MNCGNTAGKDGLTSIFFCSGSCISFSAVPVCLIIQLLGERLVVFPGN